MLKHEEELQDQTSELSQLEQIQQKLILLVNDSSVDVVAGTAKTMLKMIGNLLAASTPEDKQKFGKLKLSNKAIQKKFVKVPHALELLSLIGFKKAIDGDLDVLVFNYTEENRKALELLKENIEEWQQAQAEP